MILRNTEHSRFQSECLKQHLVSPTFGAMRQMLFLKLYLVLPSGKTIYLK